MPEGLLLGGSAARDDQLFVVDKVGDRPESVGPNDDEEEGDKGVPLRQARPPSIGGLPPGTSGEWCVARGEWGTARGIFLLRTWASRLTTDLYHARAHDMLLPPRDDCIGAREIYH